MTAEACPWCGDEPWLEVAELYPRERTFTLDACCEGAHELALAELLADPRAFGRWLEEQTGIACRSVVADPWGGLRYGNGGLVVDHGLELQPIAQAEAFAWIDQHHRHNDAPTGWRWGHAVHNGHELVAVATVGRPVARRLCPRTIVEVTRVCVDPELPAYLARNACSMLYAAATREAARRGYRRAVTYTREGELATTVRAAGWVPTHVTKIDRRGWSRADRPRAAEDRCRKLRWERGLDRRVHREVEQRRLEAARVAAMTGGPQVPGLEVAVA